MTYTDKNHDIHYTNKNILSSMQDLYDSRTLGQCLNATNSSGKNVYRTFLKYLQVSFQFGLRTQPTLNFNNNIGECLYSVRCYRSVRENAHGIVFRAVCVLPSLVSHQIKSLRDTGGIR